MKRTKQRLIVLISTIMTFSGISSVLAVEVPRESLPTGITQDSVMVAQSLVGNILDDVNNGLGYADARIRSNKAIFNAVLAGETNGNGFAVLSAIANNAIYECRDVYLRPDYYAQAEMHVKSIISDIIASVEVGYEYDVAEKEAYARIYRTVDSSFDFANREFTDFCYWNTPAIDSALFNRARKLLKEAEDRYKSTLICSY